MSKNDNSPGVPGAQKKTSHYVQKQANGNWAVYRPDGTVIESGLTYQKAAEKIKDLNK